MEDLIQLDSPVEVGARRSTRGVAVLAVLALVVGGLVIARHAAAPVTAKDKIVNVNGSPADGAGAVLGRALGFGSAPAQINISAIVCPILLSLVASLPFIAPFLQPILAVFGCTSP